MINWIKRLFVNEYKEKYIKVLHDFKGALQKQQGLDCLQYLVIKGFDVRDREFVRKISVIHDSEEFKFLLYDLRQQCVEKMVEGAVEVNVQMTGILKNLAGYDNIWKEIVEKENRDGQI
jgi:hypothetical protein